MIRPRIIPGGEPAILLLCDHASNAVPPGIALDVAPDVLDKHIAVDIGAGPLSEALADALDAPAILATVSRLVIDLNRPLDHPGLIPQTSDGYAIPGNAEPDRGARVAAFHAPYHAAIEAQIARARPVLIVAIHSFTPRLEQGGATRPWEIGILSNTDRRAADLALPLLAARGLVVGDNEPYSGRQLNATLDRHGEARGIASLSVEVRNDLIRNAVGVAEWATILAQVLTQVRNGLARRTGPAT